MVPDNRTMFRHIPFLRLLVALVPGILLQDQFDFSLSALLIGCGVVVILYFIFFRLPVAFRFRYKFLSGCLILLLFTGLGALDIYTHAVKHSASFIGNQEKPSGYLIRLTSSLSIKPQTFKASAEVEEMLQNGVWVTATGKLLVYFRKDSLLPALPINTRLIFHKQPQAIHNPGNPGEFDYQQFCARNGIFFQQFLTKNDFTVLPSQPGHYFSKYLSDARQWIMRKIDENITDSQARSVAKALLIGYRDDLDRDMLQSFSNAGVIHIIAISGLHLAMIYGIFAWLFAPVKRLRHGEFWHTFLILILIWLFTFLAGAVPSVLRAAVMLTVYLLAKFFNRQADIYNSLAVSAFILLLCNPYYLWDVGFLLSYSAVLSIAMFYKMIFECVAFQNKLLCWLWKMCAVSLSAQILTLPFVLYFFHRFPNLFIIANLVAIPLSAFILYGEIIMLALTPVMILSRSTGMLTQIFIGCFNGFIRYVGSISFSVTDNVYINVVQMLLLLTVIFLLYIFVRRREKRWLITSAFCLLGFAAVYAFKKVEHFKQRKFIVYNTSKHQVMDFISGTQFISLADTSFSAHSQEYRYVLQPSRGFYRVKVTHTLPGFTATFPLFTFYGRSIFVLNPHTVHLLDKYSNVELFLVSGDVETDFEQIKQRFPAAAFIFTNKNTLWKIDQWKKDFKRLNLHFHSVPQEGAFVLDL